MVKNIYMSKKKTDASSISDLARAFKNAIGAIFHQQPFLFIICLFILGYSLYLLSTSPYTMTIGLCLCIFVVSVIIYIKTNNYGETMLSFILGVLAVFTITWDNDKAWLFIVFYLGVNIFLFFITALKLSMEVEHVLTGAACYIDLKNAKSIVSELNIICDKPTKGGRLSKTEKAKVIQHLAYMKMPIGEMQEAIEQIEIIKVVYELSIMEACNFYRGIYFIKINSKKYVRISSFLDKIVDKRLPIPPHDFVAIFDQTKDLLIKEKLTLNNYLNKIEKFSLEGHSKDKIVNHLIQTDNLEECHKK